MITFTEHAAEVLKTFLAGDPEPSQALRISVSGAKTAPRFDLTLVEHSDRAEDETSVDASGFEVLVRESDLALLEGATVDYVERVNESGFEVRPAALPGAQAGPRHVRSVRASSYRPGGALVEQGHHAFFRFRAASAAERQRWVDAIREHSVGDPMAGVRATLSRHKSGRWAASSGEKVAAPPARTVV